jgi:hypothetical protein
MKIYSGKQSRTKGLGRPNSRRTTFEKLEDRLYLTTITFTTPSSNSGDGTWVAEQRDLVNVFVGPAYLYYNTNPNLFPGFQAGDPLYAKVNYFDEGSGTLKVQYDSVAANFDQTEFHTRSSRVDSQEFVSSYHYLDNAQFANGSNGHDFRVVVGGVPLSSVEVSNQPFPDSGLDWVWSPPWEASYAGPSREVDASTLTGKVLAGYQGWFNTPNDPTDEGYVHWGVPGDWSIEQWPDVNDYDQTEVFAVPGISTASGEQAYLFSSANSSVVDRHFQWMREHDVDGVLVQRFNSSFMFKQNDGSYVGEPQWPVVNARDAAHREGRTWSIEYDIQKSASDAERWETVQEVKDDWEYLTDTNGFDMLNDSHYQREAGQPVVTIFGLYVGSTNKYSNAQQADLIDYFHSRGVYVVGAGRGSQNNGAEQLANVGLHDAYISWQGYWQGGNSYVSDETALNGVAEHIPHVFPGFSWTHLQNDDTRTSHDREDGNFYWRMISDAANETDAPWYFIGMFDEYDEGTNIIPASDDPPVPDNDPDGDPLTYQISDPMPNDWWMALTGVAKQAVQGKISINDTIPTESELENRSNVGSEAVWQASGSDRLAVLDIPGGQIQTTPFNVDGNSFDAIHSDDDFMYFQVDDGFLLQETDGRDVTIEVEYLDSVVGQFGVEYDSTTGAYQAGDAAPLTGSGLWRTHRFDLSDAYFGNNQNGGADFRLEKTGGDLFVRRVSVIKERMLTVDTDLGSANIVNGLQQVEVAGDGQTTATINDGRSVRQLSGAPTSLYMYMRVDDDFANEVKAGLNAIVEVVYRDVGFENLDIQYDSTSAAYEVFTPVAMENSGEWRTARFYLDDAHFGNSQNDSSDFRITGNNIPIDQVRVLHSFGDLVAPELQTAPATVNTPQSTVTVAWSMTDEWKTGLMDQWTGQEDNLVEIEWTNDGGSTWSSAGEAYEHESVASLSGYDVSAGKSTWSDVYVWDTTGLVSGIYQLRMTPTDGRGNAGDPLETTAFVLIGVPALTGDYDENGVVDGDDLTEWSNAYGTSVPTGTGADGNGSGFVDGGDFLIWQLNLGSTLPPLAASEAPAAFSAATSTESIVVSTDSESAEQVMLRDAGFALLTTNSRPTFESVHLDSGPEASEVAQTDYEVLLLLAVDVAPVSPKATEYDFADHDEAFSDDKESVELEEPFQISLGVM